MNNSIAIDQILEVAKRADIRNKIVYTWLRYLVLLAFGGLTALGSIHAGKSYTGIPRFCMSTALVSIGIGILLGSISLYAEVWSERDLVSSMVNKIRDTSSGLTTGIDISSISYTKPPKIFRAFETGCYFSLSIFIASFVIFSITG